MSHFKCKLCGKDFIKSNEYFYEPRDAEYCEDCRKNHYEDIFWFQIIEEKDDHVFIDGCSYYVDDEQSKSYFRGFGGAKFIIKIFDTGKIIETTNLWFQGVIPEKYRDILKDTAEFVRS